MCGMETGAAALPGLATSHPTPAREVSQSRTVERRSPTRFHPDYDLAREFEIEMALGARLRLAGPGERRGLYVAAYEAVVARTYGKSLEVRQEAMARRRRHVANQARALAPWLDRRSHFLEIGPGDGRLALACCGLAGRVTALDVRDALARPTDLPCTFELVVGDGADVPLPPASVDLAFSDQLVEHLHPSDLESLLAGVASALKPGGAFICLTPNRLLGPHDLSGRFGRAHAEGLHLRELTLGELAQALTQAGLTRPRRCWAAARCGPRRPWRRCWSGSAGWSPCRPPAAPPGWTVRSTAEPRGRCWARGWWRIGRDRPAIAPPHGAV